MWKLWLGVALFGGPHLFSMILPHLRDDIRVRMGRGKYMGIYSIASLAGMVFLAMGYLAGRSGPASLSMVYEPWFEGRHVMMLLVFVGFVLIFANNSRGYIRKFLQHPFSIGVALWSVGHLLVNGETSVVVIFAMLLGLALLNVVLGLARGRVQVATPNVLHDLRAVVVGTVLFFVFALGFHPYILNIPVLG